jgi:hypothetical protein
VLKVQHTIENRLPQQRNSPPSSNIGKKSFARFW